MNGKAAIAQKRLFGTVPDEIEPYFDLFMYVSKAKRGPLAQQMFVFQRDADGRIIPYAEWKVSTGREKLEIKNERRVRTNTPEGIFQLDARGHLLDLNKEMAHMLGFAAADEALQRSRSVFRLMRMARADWQPLVDAVMLRPQGHAKI